MNRRSFIAAAGGAALAYPAHAKTGSKPFFAFHDLPIGLQLYTLNPQLDADFDGTLAAVAKIGYRSVELAGFHGRSGAELRAAFDRAGLICRSAHIPAHLTGQGFSLDGDLGKLADEMHAIGVETVVMPAFLLPDRLAITKFTLESFIAAGHAMTADDWKANADFLNAKAKTLARYGLGLAYHNHNFEFAPIGETMGLDILLGGTDPSRVTFEMDVGWAEAAGADPIALMAAHPGRFRQMHVKDIKATTKLNFEMKQDPTEVGRGKIDWERILPDAYAQGVRGFYVEQEPPYAGERLALIATSLRYLQTLPA
jgi:sugar phosphate isomerase/epimerase